MTKRSNFILFKGQRDGEKEKDRSVQVFIPKGVTIIVLFYFKNTLILLENFGTMLHQHLVSMNVSGFTYHKEKK